MIMKNRAILPTTGAWTEQGITRRALARGGDHGRCGLFQRGEVHVTGWCTSYIDKPGV